MAFGSSPYTDLAGLSNEQLADRLETAWRVHDGAEAEIRLRKEEGFLRRWWRGDFLWRLSWNWSPGTRSDEIPWLGGYWPPNPHVDRSRTQKEIEHILEEMKRRV